MAFSNRGLARRFKREYDQALADFNESIRLDPKRAKGHLLRAALLATCPDEKYRDGKQAIESAIRSCELTEWKAAHCVGALAAAHAETGDALKDHTELVLWLGTSEPLNLAALSR